MTYPYAIHIGNNSLLLHGIFEFLGIFIALRYYLWLKRKSGDTVSSYNRLAVVCAAILGAVLGSRIVGALENVPAWMASPSPLKYFYGNKTLLGGLLGGLASVELVKKMLGEPQKTGDLFVFPLLLGMIIGRIGCFSAGVYEKTYGTPSILPWAMDLGDGIYRHPVVLYEILFLLLLWYMLATVNKRYILTQGALFKMFLIAYLVFRFLLDFIKPGWRYLFGLGTIQITSLAGLVYYAKYLFRPQLLICSKKAYAR